jgi:hypothetical protein
MATVIILFRLLNQGWISRIENGPYTSLSSLVQYTHPVGETGLGPAVLASDGQAMIRVGRRYGSRA